MKHTYHLSGSQIVAEEWGTNLVFYLYDADGSPIGMQYRNSSYAGGVFETYWFEKNMQGDIVAVYDVAGTLLISYVYDAWGNCTINYYNGGYSSNANLNPFRYRGYYFDSETGLYYLQSRYYNPSWGRFISADTTSVLTTDYMDHLQYNLYAYAFNNPVNLMDQAGMWPSWATKVVIGTAVIAAAAILTVATAGTGTALACFAVGALKGALVGATVGAATGAASGAVTHRISTGSWEGAGQAAIEGAADGYMTGAISGFISGGVSNQYCFIAGTPVATQYGLVPIEDISPGDLVWATNPETGQTELKQVVQLFRNETEEWVHVSVNGEKITATPSHPFYSPVKGWTKAIELRAGDILVMLNGEYVVVEQVPISCPLWTSR